VVGVDVAQQRAVVLGRALERRVFAFAQVDTDAEFDAFLFWHSSVAFGQGLLHLGGGPHRLYGARELCQ